MKSPISFDGENFNTICDLLAERDNDFLNVITRYGYPPIWKRDNTFEAIVHIILEQQVSLASALAHLDKLKERVGEITPSSILELTDDEMRDNFISRQKANYIRGVALAILNKELDLNTLSKLSDDEVRGQLIKLKGIGNWTIDIYLMLVLQRSDIFPIGDLAIVAAIKKLKNLDQNMSNEYLLRIADSWKPYRTVATMILWHFYLSTSRS